MSTWLLLSALFAGQANAHDAKPIPGPAATFRPKELNGAGVEQKLGTQVPKDIEFVDDNAKTVHLADYFESRPVVLVLAYYKCPMLCSEVLNGLFESLGKCGLSLDQYEVVVASFDARESPELATAKRQHYLDAHPRPGLADRVHFLTGSQASIDALTKAIGFSYGYDSKSDQFAHPGMVTLLTPTGTIARYFFGIRFQPRDLRLGLIDASDGKIGSVVDSFILYCLYYDPNGATYAASVLRIVRIAGAATVVLLLGGLFWAFRRERKRAGVRITAC